MNEILAYLETIAWRGMEPGLKRICEAFRLTGNPEKKIRIIHIAGTNGKGSVACLTAQLLAVNGSSVGLSLSPHINDYRERMQFYAKGDESPRLPRWEDLVVLHQSLRNAIGDAVALTYFEWSILLAVHYFASQGFDFAVLETGMGGRWDATNACPSVVSGVTTVGFDHMTYLGDTLLKIAAEKQEIAKPGADFLFGPEDAELCRQAQAHCQKIGARYRHVKEFSEIDKYDNPYFSDRPETFRSNFKFTLCLGKILLEKGVAIDLEKFSRLNEFHFPPARFQKVSVNPVMVIDGAHNEPALKILKRHVDRVWAGEYDLAFGCLKDRDFKALASIIRPQDGKCYWVKFSGDGRETPDAVYEEIRNELGGEIQSVGEALLNKLQRSRRPVLVCGSLYFAAQFLNLISR